MGLGDKIERVLWIKSYTRDGPGKSAESSCLCPKHSITEAIMLAPPMIQNLIRHFRMQHIRSSSPQTGNLARPTRLSKPLRSHNVCAFMKARLVYVIPNGLGLNQSWGPRRSS